MAKGRRSRGHLHVRGGGKATTAMDMIDPDARYVVERLQEEIEKKKDDRLTRDEKKRNDAKGRITIRKFSFE